MRSLFYILFFLSVSITNVAFCSNNLSIEDGLKEIDSFIKVFASKAGETERPSKIHPYTSWNVRDHFKSFKQKQWSKELCKEFLRKNSLTHYPNQTHKYALGGDIFLVEGLGRDRVSIFKNLFIDRSQFDVKQKEFIKDIRSIIYKDSTFRSRYTLYCLTAAAFFQDPLALILLSTAIDNLIKLRTEWSGRLREKAAHILCDIQKQDGDYFNKMKRQRVKIEETYLKVFLTNNMDEWNNAVTSKDLQLLISNNIASCYALIYQIDFSSVPETVFQKGRDSGNPESAFHLAEYYRKHGLRSRKHIINCYIVASYLGNTKALKILQKNLPGDDILKYEKMWGMTPDGIIENLGIFYTY